MTGFGVISVCFNAIVSIPCSSHVKSLERRQIMILEVAILDVIPGKEREFQRDFQQAQNIIISMPGYLNHELGRCLEQHSRYILFVRWETLEDHTIGFRQSPEYQHWKQLLHHYYHPFPRIEHYQKVFSS